MEKALKCGELVVPELTQEERLGLGKVPADIMSLEDMARFIDDHQRTVLSFSNPTRTKYIKDPLLKFVDELLDDSLLDRLLALPGMTPSKRDWMPSRLLRIELLRTFRFSTWGGRGFCNYLSDLERKEERAFCRLPLHQKEMCAHNTLSAFRSSLTLEQRVNLMVYIMHHFFSSGYLGEGVVHMLDSTEVAIPVNSAPLCKMETPDGSTIRFYSDLDCDCGKRRNKRDKSAMLVGYRLHTLCVADVESGIAFPLLSLATAANHHDSQLLDPILTLAAAVGLEMKILSVDEAYADAEKQDRLRKEQDLCLVTPPKAKAEAPSHVELEKGAVFCHEICEAPMRYDGYDKEDGGHIFVCAGEQTDCPWSNVCPKERVIPIDTGYFGPLPSVVSQTQKVIDFRKVTERPFNLIKHHDGLEPCRMRTQATVSAQALFSQILGIFKVMAGLRAAPKTENQKKQEVLPMVVNG